MEDGAGYLRGRILFFPIAFILLFSALQANVAYATSPDCGKLMYVANLGGWLASDPSMYRMGNTIIIAGQGGGNVLYAKEYDITKGMVKDWYMVHSGGYTCAQPKFVYEHGSLWIYARGGSNCDLIWKTQYLGSGNWSDGILVTGQAFGDPGPESDGYYQVYLKNGVPILAQCYSESPLMEAMRKKGCIWNGLLQQDGMVADELISLLARSKCESLSRIVEDWGMAPNFALFQKNIDKIKNKITDRNLVLGFYIPEAIDYSPNVYYYPDENRYFNFTDACNPNYQKDNWGANQCMPYYKNAEYRTYLRYVTKKAIDMGFQDILFGQTYYCDDMADPVLPDIVSEIRQYARLKGKEIVIGAQTGSENFQIFDYIWAGLGQQADGTLDWNLNPACSSKYTQSHPDWGCWTLLWRPEFASKAHNVLVSFDWWASYIDDTSMFSRMQKPDRARVLEGYYNQFTGTGFGFQMPFIQPVCWAELGPERGGDLCNQNCRSWTSGQYTPDNNRNCKDEDVINSILSGSDVKTIYDRATFVNQNAPVAMDSGKIYSVSIKMRNTGNVNWTSGNYSLKSIGNNVWGVNDVPCFPGETISPDCVNSTDVAGLGGYAGSNPSLYRFADGKIIIAAQGGHDNGVYVKEFDTANNQTIKDWYRVGATSCSQFQSKLINENNDLWMYVIGCDDTGRTWKAKYTSSGNWTSWEQTTSTNLGQPGPSSDGTYKVYNNVNSPVLSKCNQPNNSEKTFTFTVTTPSASGVYDFQWRMAKADGTLFGDSTSSIQVTVRAVTTTTTTTTTTSTSRGSSTTSTTLRVLGDANGDGHVDYNDLIILAASYGKQQGQTGFDGRADFNGDGIVDYDDLIVLAMNYGK